MKNIKKAKRERQKEKTKRLLFAKTLSLRPYFSRKHFRSNASPLCRQRKNSQQSNHTDSDPVSYEFSADSLLSDSDKVSGVLSSHASRNAKS